jgi:Putative MetA-pathway of phenol degradation
MARFLFLLVGFCSCTVYLQAQEKGRMETDRPDQTESPFLTKIGYLQGELGFNYERTNGQTQWIHPTALWKFGINRRFEFRVITELQTTQQQTGLLPLQLGGKLSLVEEKGLRPKTSLIAHLAIPQIGHPAFRIPKWAPNFRFTFQNSLSENAAIGYNLGAVWDGISPTPDWIYTFAPGLNVGEKGYAYVELYGSIRSHTSPQHSLAGGVAYYVSDNFKIDLSASYGLTEAATGHYIAIGFSFRAPVKKK